jgi:hypothetical protein
MLERLDLPWSVALESAVVDPPRRLPSEQPDSPLTGLIGSEMIELAPSVRIDRRLPVDGVPDGDLVLVDEAGDPVLLDAPVGAGRVVFFAVTPELAWTDLPVRPLMVPLVQEIARQEPRCRDVVVTVSSGPGHPRSEASASRESRCPGCRIARSWAMEPAFRNEVASRSASIWRAGPSNKW